MGFTSYVRVCRRPFLLAWVGRPLPRSVPHAGGLRSEVNARSGTYPLRLSTEGPRVSSGVPRARPSAGHASAAQRPVGHGLTSAPTAAASAGLPLNAEHVGAATSPR